MRSIGASVDRSFTNKFTGKLTDRSKDRPKDQLSPPLLPRRPRLRPCEEAEVVRAHVHLQADKFHALVFQAEALFHGGFAGKQDFAAGADHALPRQSAGAVQRPRHLARRAGESSGVGDVAIGRDLAAGNTPPWRSIFWNIPFFMVMVQTGDRTSPKHPA